MLLVLFFHNVRADGKKKGNEKKKEFLPARKMPPQEATIENPKEIIKSKKGRCFGVLNINHRRFFVDKLSSGVFCGGFERKLWWKIVKTVSKKEKDFSRKFCVKI